MIAAAVINILNANKLKRPLYYVSYLYSKYVYLLTVRPSGHMRVLSVLCDYKYCQLS